MADGDSAAPDSAAPDSEDPDVKKAKLAGQKKALSVNSADPASVLRAFGGSPAAMNSGVGTARGETGGSVAPALAGLDPATLAKLDRYSQGAQFRDSMGGQALMSSGIGPLVAGGLGAAYEGSKLLPASVQTGLGSLLGGRGPEFTPDATTSAPSGGNVWALIQGYLHGGGQ